MKKFFCLVCLLFTLTFAVACKSGVDFDGAISEVCTEFYAFENEDYYITFAKGEREEDYVVDGKSGKLIEYAVLTVHNTKLAKTNNSGSFVISSGSERKSGVFEQNPFDGSFVVDLKQFKTDLGVIKLEISFKESNLSCELENCLLEGNMGLKDVKSLAFEEFGLIKEQISSGKNVKGEIYFRIIKQKGLRPLWYVSLIDENGKLYALIIDPANKTLITKNFK